MKGRLIFSSIQPSTRPIHIMDGSLKYSNVNLIQKCTARCEGDLTAISIIPLTTQGDLADLAA